MTKMTKLKAIGILLAIPIVLYGASAWLTFWLNRPISEYMALGIGLPVAMCAAGLYLWDCSWK